MSLNWYKISKLKRLERDCLAYDKKLFQAQKVIDDEVEITQDEPVEDIDPSHQYRHISDRIEEGKKREDDLINKINKSTIFILEGTGIKEDISGIDAYIVGYRGSNKPLSNPLSVQIKHRLSGGDDLGLEIMKGWPPLIKDISNIEFNGKDTRSTVDYYFHIDRTGHLRIFNGKLIREIAQSMVKQAIKDWMHGIFNGNNYRVNGYGSVHIIRERGQGGYRPRNNSKVIVYIDVNNISPTFEFDL